MRRKLLFVITAALLLVSTALLIAQTLQSGENLFQQALQKERADRDIDGAIKIYERIVSEFAANRSLTAKALVQLGLCYEKLGESKSTNYFQQVIAKYSDQPDMVATARSRVTGTAVSAAKL